MPRGTLISAFRLRELLDYDPATGAWTWLVDRGPKVKAGDVAGSKHWYKKDKTFRRVIKIEDRLYLASRLAFLYLKSRWPHGQVDHQNTDTIDDRWKNLREATQTQNMYNRKTQRNNHLGVKGIRKRGNRFSARIKTDGKSLFLGSFETMEEAAAVHLAATKRYAGYFARSGEDAV